MAMDEQKKQPQNPVQPVSSIAREVERPVSDYSSEKEIKFPKNWKNRSGESG